MHRNRVKALIELSAQMPNKLWPARGELPPGSLPMQDATCMDTLECIQRSRLQTLLRSHGMLKGGAEQLCGDEVQGRVHDVSAGDEAGHGDPLLPTQVLIDGRLMLQVRQGSFVSCKVPNLRTSAAVSAASSNRLLWILLCT